MDRSKWLICFWKLTAIALYINSKCCFLVGQAHYSLPTFQKLYTIHLHILRCVTPPSKTPRATLSKLAWWMWEGVTCRAVGCSQSANRSMKWRIAAVNSIKIHIGSTCDLQCYVWFVSQSKSTSSATMACWAVIKETRFCFCCGSWSILKYPSALLYPYKWMSRRRADSYLLSSECCTWSKGLQ